MKSYRKQIGLAIGTAILAAAPLIQIHAEEDVNCSSQDAMPMPIVETMAAGPARLCVLPGTLKGKLKLSGLVPGNAYTVWWVYFDDASSCSGGSGICGMADFFGEKPVGIFGRFGSGVAPRNGALHFQDSLDGMEPSAGSQVWLFAWGHGAASDDGDRLARQLLTPEDPTAGAPHLGNLVDGPRGYPVANAVFNLE